MSPERPEHRFTDHTEFQAQDIPDWQREAVNSFVEQLNERNPDLTAEIARETGAHAATDHQVSWLDHHNGQALHPFHADYSERDLNPAELDILVSYRRATSHMDDVQASQLAITIAQAMTRRPNLALDHHFPDNPDHQHADVPEPHSHQTLMLAARRYYANALQDTETLLADSLHGDELDAYPMTWAVDTLRTLEKDFERTTTHGDLPSHLDRNPAADDLRRAYHQRGSALAEAFTKDYAARHPDQPLDPTDPGYLQAFHQATAGYRPGDLHSTADQIASAYAVSKTNSANPRPLEGLPDDYHETKTAIYRSLTTQPDPEC